jgi:hypothetical protein
MVGSAGTRHAPMARLQLSTGRGLFDGVADRAGDSEEGVRQGSAESSAVFCVGIAPELAALDRELAAVGGVARGDADDVYYASSSSGTRQESLAHGERMKRDGFLAWHSTAGARPVPQHLARSSSTCRPMPSHLLYVGRLRWHIGAVSWDCGSASIASCETNTTRRLG